MSNGRARTNLARAIGLTETTLRTLRALRNDAVQRELGAADDAAELAEQIAAGEAQLQELRALNDDNGEETDEGAEADNDMDDDDDAFVDPGEFETFNGDADQELSEVGKVRSDFLNHNRFNPY